MRRIACLSAAAALVVALAAPALAAPGQTLHRTSSAANPSAARVVMMCDNDAATRSAFRRQHGVAPTFVTAEQMLHARVRGETWSAPRCMNAREHALLTETLSARASVR